MEEKLALGSPGTEADQALLNVTERADGRGGWHRMKLVEWLVSHTARQEPAFKGWRHGGP